MQYPRLVPERRGKRNLEMEGMDTMQTYRSIKLFVLTAVLSMLCLSANVVFAATFATLTTNFAGANNDLVLTATVPGSGGNSVALAIAYVESPNANLGYMLGAPDGKTLCFILGTDENGASITTAADLKAVIENNPEMSALVSVDFAPGNDGSGVISSGLDRTELSGGQD